MNGYSATVSGLTPLRYFTISALSLAVIFAILEPAGARDIGFLKGLALWILQMLILIPLLIVTQKWLGRLSLEVLRNPWTLTFVAGLCASTVYAPLGLAIDTIFEVPDESEYFTFVQALIDEWSGVLPPVTLCWLLLNAPWILKLSFQQAEENSDAGYTTDLSDDEHVSDLFKLLPPEIGTDIVYIEAELHYVKVVTPISQALVLYALRDATHELPNGIQIHRSYWVALKHVASLGGTRAKPYCVMKNGARLPIGRRREAQVREKFANYVSNNSLSG